MTEQKQKPLANLPSFQKMLWHPRERADLIPLLQAAQDMYGYIPLQAIYQISEATGVPYSDIYGVITFYTQFRLQPMGRYVIRLCKGTACHVSGAEMLGQTIEDELKITPNETDPEGIFTYMPVACLGCCSLAPVVMINEDTHGRLDPDKLRKILRKYRKKARQEAKEAA